MDCPHCLFRNPAGNRFCGQCGALLESRQTGISAPDDQAERRHLTVMFCDLAGSVALSTALDPEEFRELLSRYLEAATTVVRRFSGFVGQYHGDGMLGYFGYPKAREDSAVLGVRAGLGILRAIQALNAESGTSLQVRIGLHTGLLVIGELGSGDRRESSVVIGKTPNLAARMQTLAQPGTVVISAETWKLVHGHFECESLGAHAVKGLLEPVEVFQVLGDLGDLAARSPAAHLTALYGRGSELRHLQTRWNEVAAGGAARLAVTGEAGIGKSRLVRELAQSLDGQPHCRLVARGSAAAQNSAFEPLLQLLRDRFEIRPSDSAEEQLEKVTAGTESLHFPADTAAMLMAVLCPDEALASGAPALSPSAVRQRLIAWFPELLRALAQRQPVLLLIEDLHWIDPSTHEALGHLLALPPLAHVFIALTARPEFSAPWLPAETLALEPLPEADVAQFAEAVGGGKALPAEVVRQIVAKANGIPLFIEEMMKMVLETGLLVERDAHFETRAPLPPMAIPDTLHELLMARLDGTAPVREVAQLAAVLGQEFEYPMLRALSTAEEHLLREQLGSLVAAGLLSQEGDFPQARFAFRHALIQAEAYQSLLKRKRQIFHERIAAMLAEQFPETLRQKPELVAHHYTEAGRHAEAIDLWLQAAIRSEARSASAEAIAQAGEGVRLLASPPTEQLRQARELSLIVVRGRAAAVLHGYAADEVEQTYSRARELCGGDVATPEKYQVLGVLHAFYTARAEFGQAGEIAEQMMQLGETTGLPGIIDNAWLSRGTNAFYLGKLVDAVRCFERAIEHYVADFGSLPPRTLDIKVAALAWGGLALILLGEPDRGLAWVQEARAWAIDSDRLHSIGFARHFLQLAHYWRDEPESVLAEARGFADFCREQGFIYWLSLGIMIEGWALVRLRRGGLPLLHRGMGIWQRTGARLGSSQHFALCAEAVAFEGDAAEGNSLLAQAEEFQRATGERCYAPHVAELKGTLALRGHPADEKAAEVHFRESLWIARELRAAWLELRAAIQLAPLLAASGRNAEARTLMEECLHRIAGGEETSPMQQARRWLAEQS